MFYRMTWQYIGYICICVLGTVQPQAPKDLQVNNLTHDAITLSWQPPESDGGAPINNYIIVMRETSKKKFKKVGKVDATTLTFTLNTDLKESSEYALRVYAENQEGVSDVAAELDDVVKLPSRPVEEVAIKGEFSQKTEEVMEESTVKQKVKGKEKKEVTEETKVSQKVKGKEGAEVTEEVKVDGNLRLREEEASDAHEQVGILWGHHYSHALCCVGR